MATPFPFELVSPERLLVSEPVEEVIVPGREGEFTVLAGHAPFVSVLKPGVVVVKRAGKTERLFVRGGLAEVTPTKGLTILAEQALPLAELDAAKLDAQIRDAEEDVSDAQTEDARQRAAETLARLRELREALGNGTLTAH